jgi:large subunit ribosomal protein L4
MATHPVLSGGAGKGGSVELDPAVFEAPVKPHLFHAEVRRQLALRHRGTHSTKNRAAVSGGGVKPWRQKGTGRARQGTIRAPQWAGGGVVFGPVPRSYAHELPKKVRRAALRAALSLRKREDALLVVDELAPSEPKTRRLVELLRGFGLDGKSSVLIATQGADEAVERAARNLPWATVLRVVGLNTYDVLRHDKLLVTRAALDAIHARLNGTPDAASEAEESPEESRKRPRSGRKQRTVASEAGESSGASASARAAGARSERSQKLGAERSSSRRAAAQQKRPKPEKKP